MNTFKFHSGALLCALIVISSTLTGCFSRDENVRIELKELTKSVKPKIKALPAAVNYEPLPYEVEALADPFSPTKTVSKASAASPQPDMRRTKEALEAYPLESIRMVGTLKASGVLQAAVSVDGFLYKVRPGQYIGQNFGKVLKVTETSVFIKEMVQEPGGDWSEHETTLSMQDSTEVKKK